MNDQPAPLEISLTMTAGDAWEFLRRATTEAEFRERLEQDPAGTLAGCGIVVSQDALPQTVTLPSLDQVRELARMFAPEIEFDEEGWCPPPAGNPFATCLWLSIGFAAAHRSNVSDPGIT